MAKIESDYLAGIFAGSEKLKQAVSGQVMEVDMESLEDFSRHTFQVKDDEDMKELAESIRIQGIIEPLIVRKKGNVYEIISGHRRRFAAIKAGLKSVPVYVADLTDDEAVVAMVDANMRRTSVLPSELAYSFRAKAEALKHMGIRDENGTTSRQIGEAAGKSGRTVERYIRLTYLIRELMEQVDRKKLPVDVGVMLSFLKEKDQYCVYECCEDYHIRMTAGQAKELKAQKDTLTESIIMSILCKEKKKQRQIVLKEDRLDRYFPPEMPYEKREQIIIELLEKYIKETK